MSDEDALQLIFASGVSTAEKITDISGRGVGMDVVRNNKVMFLDEVETSLHTRLVEYLINLSLDSCDITHISLIPFIQLCHCQ